MANPIGWVEVPASNIERAIAFYNEVFGWSLQCQPFGELQMAMFPGDMESTGASGALVYYPEFYQPSETAGPLVYFSCDDAGVYADKSEKAGGRIVVPKREISPEYGFMSVVIDVEGNRIAFHSMR